MPLTFTEEDFQQGGSAQTNAPLTFTEADFAAPEKETDFTPVMPKFEPPAGTIAATPPDIAEAEAQGKPLAEIEKGFDVIGRSAIGALADVGKVFFRPVTEELYPEQAVPGAMPDMLENIKAAPDLTVPLPGKDLRTLPKSLQIVGAASQGLIETAPKMAAVGAAQAIGVPAPIAAGGIFGLSPEGFDPKQAAIAAALPFVGKYSGEIAGAIAKRFGVDNTTAINWIKGISGTAGPAAALVAQQEAEIRQQERSGKLPPEQAKQARIDMWANIAGQVALGPMGVKFEKGAADALHPQAEQVLRDVRPQPGEGAREVPAEGASAEDDARRREALAKEAQVSLSPDDQKYLDEERKAIDAPVEVVPEVPAGQPFAGNIATIDRASGKILINGKQFTEWLQGIPEANRSQAVRSLLSEERIHLGVDDASALEFWNTLTAAEKAIRTRSYTGEFTRKAAEKRHGISFSDTDLGHEALRYRMQQLARMTPREIAEVVGKEKWTLQMLDGVESVIRKIREKFGTEASGTANAIVGRMQGNLEAARAAITGTAPGALRKDAAEKEAERVASMSPADFADWAKATGRGATGAGYEFAKQVGEQGRSTLEKFAKRQEEELDASLERMRGAKPDEMMKLFTETAQRSSRKQFFDEGIRLLDAAKDVKSGMSPEEAARKNGVELSDTIQLSREPGALRKKKEPVSERQQELFLPPAPKAEARPSAEQLGAIPETPEAKAARLEAEAKRSAAAKAKAAIKPVTGFAAEKSAYSHLQEATDAMEREMQTKGPEARPEPPSFSKFKKDFKAQFGPVQPGKLVDLWEGAVYRRLLNASGDALNALRRGLNLESKVGGRPIGNPPATRPTTEAELRVPGEGFPQMRAEATERRATAKETVRQQAAQQRYRSTVIRAIAQKLVGQAHKTLRSFERPSIDATDVAKDNPQAFVEIHEQDLKHPELLTKQLTGEGVRASSMLPESVTKRLTVLMDRKSGKVYAVDTYRTFARGKEPGVRTERAMLLDPLDPTKRAHKPIGQLLEKYRPLYSILLDEPVKDFKQKWDSLGSFQDTFGTEARDVAQRGIEELPSGEEEGPPALQAARVEPLTDREVRAVLTHMYEEVGKIEEPEDMKLALEPIITAAKEGRLTPAQRVVVSALEKSYQATKENLPKLSDEQAVEHVLNTYYENAYQAESEEGFVQQTLGDFTRRTTEAVPAAKPAPSTARELAIKRTFGPTVVRPEQIPPEAAARMAAEKRPAPPVPEGTLVPAKSAPGALRRMKQATVEGGNKVREEIRASITRGTVKRDLPAMLDGAERTADAATLQARTAIENASTKPTTVTRVTRTGTTTVQAGKPDRATAKKVRAASKAVIATGSTSPQGVWSPDQSKLPDLFALVNTGMNKANAWIASRNPIQRYWGRKWKAAVEELNSELEYARDHWNDPELQETVKVVRKEFDDQVKYEQANGFSTKERENYIPGRYEADFFNDKRISFAPFSGTMRLLGEQFRRGKVFANYYDAIATGPYIPASYDIADIAQARIARGLYQIAKLQTFEAFKGITDPESGKPIATDPKMIPTGREITDPATGVTVKEFKYTEPSPEHSLVYPTPGGKPIAVREGFKKAVEALTLVSKFEHWPGGKEALMISGMLKHGGILVGDLFHPSRLMQIAQALSGKKFWEAGLGFKGGYSALAYRENELPRAVARGYITPEAARWASERIAVRDPAGNVMQISRADIAKELLRGGMNAMRLTDGLYKDAVQKIPFIGESWHKIVGRYNNWLFNRYVPGLMVESAVQNFERINSKYPDRGLGQTVRDVALDMNITFGNMGRQGVFKHPTFRDFAQTFLLAPAWAEGLLQKEARTYGRLGRAGYQLATGRPRAAAYTMDSPMVRGMIRGLAGYAILTQVINLITKKQLTFQNEEKGHKWDAWIPTPGGGGIWVSPLSVFAEVTHDVIRLTETKPRVWDAINQIGENKLGPWGKLALVLKTGETPSGVKPRTTAGVLGAAAGQLAPVPISIGPFIRAAGHAIAPETISPNRPGTLPRTFVAFAGIKGEAARTTLQDVQNLARKWKEKNNIPITDIVPTDDPTYNKLRGQLRNGDLASAKQTLAGLRKNHTDEKIIDDMRKWARMPLTGSKEHERDFLMDLSAEDLNLYHEAQLQKMDELNVFEDWFLKQ